MQSIVEIIAFSHDEFALIKYFIKINSGDEYQINFKRKHENEVLIASVV